MAAGPPTAADPAADIVPAGAMAPEVVVAAASPAAAAAPAAVVELEEGPPVLVPGAAAALGQFRPRHCPQRQWWDRGCDWCGWDDGGYTDGYI